MIIDRSLVLWTVFCCGAQRVKKERFRVLHSFARFFQGNKIVVGIVFYFSGFGLSNFEFSNKNVTFQVGHLHTSEHITTYIFKYVVYGKPKQITKRDRL